MSEQRRDEPSIDPQPGELGNGQVAVRGGTERVGAPDTGAAAGRGTTGGTGPGGLTGGGRDEEEASEEDDAPPAA